MPLKIVQCAAGVVRNDAAPLHRPSCVNHLTRIISQVLLQDGARWFWICIDIAIESAEGSCFMLDFAFHLGVGGPCTNCHQTQRNSVKNSHACKVKTDNVVMRMIDTMQISHPVACEVETRQPNGHKYGDGQNAKEPNRKVVDPVNVHELSLDSNC